MVPTPGAVVVHAITEKVGSAILPQLCAALSIRADKDVRYGVRNMVAEAFEEPLELSTELNVTEVLP